MPNFKFEHLDAQMANNALKQIEHENKKLKHNLRSESEMSIRDEAKGIFDESNEIQEALSRSYGTPDVRTPSMTSLSVHLSPLDR